MSLLFFDGFKNYTFLPLKWDECTYNCCLYIKGSSGRQGGNVLAATTNYSEILLDFLQKNLPGDTDEIIIGFAQKRLINSTDNLVISFCYNDIIQSNILVSNIGVSWYTTSMYNSIGKNQVILLNTWHYIEVKIKIHDTTGTVTIKVDEVTVLNLTNLNTSTVSPLVINNLKFNTISKSLTALDFVYIEDLYVINTLGGTNNSFLGNCKVSHLSPGANGSFNQFIPSPTYSGTANYAIVNDSTYIGSSTTYNGTFYEYDGLDDGGYTCYDNANFVFNNTSTNIPVDIHLYVSKGVNYIWFRFSNVSVPKNAKISTAYLDINNIYTPNNNCTVEIRAQKSFLVVSQIISSSDLLSRKLTYTSHKPGNVNFNSINIAPVIQELVDQVGWVEDNNSILIIIKFIHSNYDWVRNQYSSYEVNNDPYHINSPKFFIEWSLPWEKDLKYITANTVDKKDSYLLTVSSGITGVKAVSSSVVAKRDYDTDVYLRGVVVSGTTYNSNAVFLPKTRYNNNMFIFDKDPITNDAWLGTSLISNEFGFITTVSG
jgi:hypothetical protein